MDRLADDGAAARVVVRDAQHRTGHHVEHVSELGELLVVELAVFVARDRRDHPC